MAQDQDRETIGGFLPPSASAPQPPPPPAAPQPLSPPAAPAAGGPASRGGTNGKATLALGFGVAGLVVVPFVCSVLALVLGYRARDEIARTGQGGAGSAQAGIVLGWVGLAGFVILLVAVLGFGAELPTLRGSD
jgi:hypothetical protein